MPFFRWCVTEILPNQATLRRSHQRIADAAAAAAEDFRSAARSRMLGGGRTPDAHRHVAVQDRLQWWHAEGRHDTVRMRDRRCGRAGVLTGKANRLHGWEFGEGSESSCETVCCPRCAATD